MLRAWPLVLVSCGRIGFDASTADGDGSIDPDGEHVAGCKVGPEVIVAGGNTNAWGPQLLWNGSRLGIAWSEAIGEYEVMFALANADGVPAMPQNISNAAEHSWFPTLAWSGAEFAMAWSDDRTGSNDIRFARIDASTGTRIGSDVAVTAAAGDGWWPSITFADGGYEIAWSDDALDNFEIWRAELDVTGAGTPAMRTTTTPVTSWAPVVAWTGTHVFFAWGEEGAVGGIFARVVEKSNGGVIGPKPLVAGTAALPSIVWTGSTLAMAWQDEREAMPQIVVALFDVEGNGIGTEHRISTTGPAGDPAIAWSGSGFGVAWEDARSGGDEVYFAELDAKGARIGPEVLVATVSANPAIAWTGAHYVVAYDGTRGRTDSDVLSKVVCIP